MGKALSAVDSSPCGEGQKQQEEEEALGVSKLWSQGIGPGCPGSGMGLQIPSTDPIYLIDPTPNRLGAADFLFPEMLPSRDGEGGTVSISGTRDLRPSFTLVLSPS